MKEMYWDLSVPTDLYMRARNLPDNGEGSWTAFDVRFMNFESWSTDEPRILRFSVNYSKICRQFTYPEPRRR